MAEVDQESTHVRSSKQRTTLFLSAMRHFALALRDRGWSVDYIAIDAADNLGTLAGELDKAIARWQPDKMVMTAPGDWRVLQSLRQVANQHGLHLDIREDTHFFTTVRDFAAHAADRKQIRLE
jgi:deoxyribodipyrimidine photolyase-related protein